jgi:RNA polymerase sigma factor for flagellar operon FliA
MVDLIRRHVPLSRGATERRRTLRDKESQLRTELGREALPHELAAALGMGENELEAMRSASEAVRFEPIDQAYADDDMAFADQSPDASALLENAELREAVAAAIATLPDRLQLITQLYFVEELNLAEIAQVLEVSIPRVHQLKAQALDKLRVALADVAEIL